MPKTSCIDCDKIIAACPELLSPEHVETCITQLIYRYAPPLEPGLNVRFWDATNGPHIDPLEWVGPSDYNGFPLPTANPPNVTGVNNATNINDSNSGLASARYGIIDGWIYLPEGTTNLRDNNGNTGEYGMVLTAPCCASILTEQAGGNHTVNTSGGDRTLMDSVPASEGWLYIYSPQSDSGAANGLDLEYSVNGGASWLNVAIKQPTAPLVECMEHSSCDPIPDGWQLKPLKECCQAIYQDNSGISVAEVIALVPNPCNVGGDLVSDNNHSDGDWSRVGDAGTSEEFSRCDHKHPIVRIPNPGDPIIGYTSPSGSTISAQLILDRWSTEEWYAYKYRVQVSNMQPGNNWSFLTIPNIAGFQRPIITGIGNYRNGSGMPQNDDNSGNGGSGAAPRGPYMGKEWHEWSSTQRLYFGYFRRDNVLGNQFVEFVVKYVRL